MKHFTQLLLVLFTLIIYSCDKSEPENTEPAPEQKPTDKIELASGTDTNPVVPTDGGTLSISFNASTSWSAQPVNDRADTWVSVSPTSGNAGTATIKITAKANTEPDDRSAAIQIKAGTAQQTVKVTQKQKNALTVTASTFEVPVEGMDINVEVKANVALTYKIDADWISYVGTKALKASTLTFTVSKNDSICKRQGNIIIGEGELSDTVKIFQAGETPSIVLNKNSYTAKSQGETFSVDIASNVDVTYLIEYTNEDGSLKEGTENWLQESSTKTISTNTYYFNVSKNESILNRYARIIFTNKENNLCDTLSVSQHRSIYISLSQSEFELPDAGGTVKVSVDSDINYDITLPEVDWISSNSQKNGNEHSFKIDANMSDSARSANIIFSSEIYGVSDTLKIMQSCDKNFFILEDSITVSYKETLFPVPFCIRANSWSIGVIIDKEYDWISRDHTRTKSSHETDIYFKVSENTTDTDRYGKIVLREVNHNIYDTVIIKQLTKGQTVEKNFSIARKEYTIPMVAQSIFLEVEHDDTYHLVDVDRFSGTALRLENKPAFSKGNVDYHRIHIYETDTPRTMHLYLYDKIMGECDTITIIQKEMAEYIHTGHGMNIGSGLILPYSGVTFSFDIQTNLDDYKILQFPGKGEPELTHLRREKRDFGYTDFFTAPVNNSDKTCKISLVYAGKNTYHENSIYIRPKLKIVFDSPDEVVVPPSGGEFTTNVWTNDNNLNLRVEGENIAWLTLKENTKESKDEFTRLITTFEALPNTTGKQREAYIVAYNGFNDTEKVRIIQPSGATILISENLNYLGAWEQTHTVRLVDCNYTVTLDNSNGWVNIGQWEKKNGEIIQNLNIASNTTGKERNAVITFTCDTIVNTITLIQLPESDALIDNSPEIWKSFQLPQVIFKTPYPGTVGTMIYNAIVKDPKLLIEVESRKVLEQLYFSPDDQFIPRRDQIEYILDNYDGISYFSGGSNSRIVLSNQYVEKYYRENGVEKLVDENRGVLSHELTHSFQLSPRGVGDYSNPIFHACIEGMADAVRVLTGHFTEADRPRGGSYLNSYRYTGFFIAWLVKTKDKDFLRKFNLSTQYLDVWSFDGAVKYALGPEYNVDALWEEYMKAMGDK